jgi:ribose 5-phosphate isomerase B
MNRYKTGFDRNMKITIAIASDHAGYEYKKLLKHYLDVKGFQVEDFGTYSNDSVDYPDFIKPQQVL